MNNYNIRLNLFIFREIAIYLTFKKNFKEILELGLLSKSCFKIFQNIIVSNNNNNIVLEYNNFKNYVLNCNENQYFQKLIQFKDIETLSLDLGITYDYDEKKSISFLELQEFLKNNCPCLKNVVKHDVMVARYFTMNGNQQLTDKTMKGFYSFKRLIINFENFLIPASNQRELEETSISFYYSRNYEFSFEFLKFYMPKKIYISTNPNKRLCLKKINQVLNCESIESIHFFYQDTPKQFIKSSLQLKRIRSLTILYDLESDKKYLKTFKQLINGENKSLKKLRFKMGDEKYYEDGFYNGSDTNKLFEIINSNKSITSLGLEYYTITKNCDSLEPLKKIPNIDSLYCNEKSLISFLQHLKVNQNIKKLKCVKQLYDDWENFDSKKFEIEKLIKELVLINNCNQENKTLLVPSSLQTLIIEIEVFEFFEKKNVIESFKKLFNHLKLKRINNNCKNNNIEFIIIIKHYFKNIKEKLIF